MSLSFAVNPKHKMFVKSSCDRHRTAQMLFWMPSICFVLGTSGARFSGIVAWLDEGSAVSGRHNLAA